MDNGDLANKETELHSIVLEVQGTMENREKVLQDKGVFEEYRKVHSAYADRADKDLEALKRGLFIQWYASTEPGYLTGINELDENATWKIMRQIERYVTTNNLDYELKWMLTHYLSWDFAFEGFNEFTTLDNWVQSGGATELPERIDRNEMTRRGQMGRYWNSLSRFG